MYWLEPILLLLQTLFAASSRNAKSDVQQNWMSSSKGCYLTNDLVFALIDDLELGMGELTPDKTH